MYGAPKTQRCNVCEHEKPLDDDHFHRDVGNGNGYRYTCKQCRAGQTTQEKEQIVDDAFARLEKRGVQALQQISEGGSQVPHAAEVYQCIMEGFGGPRLFAQHLVACYFNPSTSQVVRSKLLTTIISMANKVSESGMITRDLETVPTESLRQMLDERMNAAVEAQMQKLRVVGGMPAPALPMIPMPPGGTHDRAAG